MGWGSGVGLFDLTFNAYLKHHPRASEKKVDAMIVELVEIFTDADWDTVGDSQHYERIAQAYKRAGRQIP